MALLTPLPPRRRDRAGRHIIYFAWDSAALTPPPAGIVWPQRVRANSTGAVSTSSVTPTGRADRLQPAPVAASCRRGPPGSGGTRHRLRPDERHRRRRGAAAVATADGVREARNRFVSVKHPLIARPIR